MGWAATLGLWALLCAPVAQAAAYDPDLEWRTLTTEHFNITFHQGEEQLAAELAVISERVWSILTVDMDHAPRRSTEVVLVDHTDVANGYASTLPINTIVIFVTGPQEQSGLALYDDWLEGIFTHEYAHILHLDTIEGLPRLLRFMMGRVISVNQLSPAWVVEGQATYMETRHTVGGRGRNPHTDMILRMSILEDEFPALGALDGWMTGPPGGNTRYLYGQSFLAYIADQSSDDAMTRWNHGYGGWILPYLLPARQTFDQSFYALYDGWKAELTQTYADQLAALEVMGLTEPELVTELDGSCSGARFSPDGQRMVYACTDRYTGSAIYVADGDGQEAELALDRRSAKSFTWRPDSTAFAYSATHIVNDFNLYEDVYFHVLGSEGAERITNGKRARDPEFSPNGERLLVVRNKAQDNDLAVIRVDQSVEALTEHSAHEQLSTPRYSPDGRFVAVSQWSEGTRDIWIYTAEGAPYRRLTLDAATDRDPTWGPDGRTLYFSSDRSGVPNIYAVDLETERLWQVTNVIGGAFQPDVRSDGAVITWQHYTANGFKVALHPLDREAWWDRGVLPRPIAYGGDLSSVISMNAVSEQVSTARWAAIGAPESPRSRPASPASIAADFLAPDPRLLSAGLDLPVFLPPRVPDQPTSGAQVDDIVTQVELEREEEDYVFEHPVAPYRALPSLLPPRFLLPTLSNTAYGLMGSLYTAGNDTLRRYAYSATINYRTDSSYVGGGFSFTWNRWRPIYGLSATTFTVPYSDILVTPEGSPGANLPGPYTTNKRYWDKRYRVSASVAYSRRQRTALYARWSGLVRTPQDPLPQGVYTANLPTRGFLSTLEAGWRYVFSQAWSYSISPEDSRYMDVRASWTTPYLGSFTLNEAGERQPFHQLQLAGEVREYISLPWAHNHVLGLRAAGGVAFGDNLAYGSFRLGGNYGQSPFFALPPEWLSLRGYPVAAVGGDGYYLGSIEYRLPFARIDWGPGALPLFLRTLHGAVFTDFGDAFNSVDQLGVPLVGAGAELRLGAVAGWGIGLNGRLGYAVSVLGDGYGSLDVGAWYFRLGTSF